MVASTPSHTARFSSVPNTASSSSMESTPPCFFESGVAMRTALGSSPGGVRKNPMGRPKPLDRANSSSAVNWRIRPPSTQRSMAEKLATDHFVPR